ncbi:MAG: CrcB family protein [Bacteroidota bacterium]
MKEVIIVGVGGFFGSAGRYAVSLISSSYFPQKPYLGTIIVNLIGCLLIGLISGGLIKSSQQQLGLLLMTGVCGGFTTFSAFALDGLKMIKEGVPSLFLIYYGISVIGGLLLCWLGFNIMAKG